MFRASRRAYGDQPPDNDQIILRRYRKIMGAQTAVHKMFEASTSDFVSPRLLRPSIRPEYVRAEIIGSRVIALNNNRAPFAILRRPRLRKT